MTTRSELRFAPASEDDFEDLLLLRIEAMRDSLERIGRFDPVRARERFRTSFSAAHTRHILINNEHAGFVAVKPIVRGLLLDHLYIRPAFQNRGIGAWALEQVFGEADAARQTLRVGALRESDSNRFYLRHGFTKTDEDEWDIYYIRPADADPKASSKGALGNNT